MKAMNRWDKLGILISGLCVVHCLAIPIVILMFPAISMRFFPAEDSTHIILLAFILGVAGVAFHSGYRQHGKWQPLAWLAAGLALVLFATFFVHDHMGHAWEPIFAIIGSVCLIRAHYLNHICKKCEHDHVSHHHEN